MQRRQRHSALKKLLVLGAGTAGTAVANRLVRRLPGGWQVTVVDPAPRHLFQPDLVLLPFGLRDERDLVRPREATLRPGVKWVARPAVAVDSDERRLVLGNGDRLDYDLLVVATGASPRREQTAGLLGDHWRRTVHDFYSLQGALRLRAALAGFTGGRLLIGVFDAPHKYPVAPLEFAFLAAEHFTRRGIRERVELTLATPFDGAFGRPLASSLLGSLLESRGVRLVKGFSTREVLADEGRLLAEDGRREPYDLLVTIPTHGGAPFLEDSGLGNELGFVPTEPRSLLARGHDHIFALGDATDLSTPKVSSVAHFEAEVVAANVLRAVNGQSLIEDFDGHASGFIETGGGRAVAVDFNYDTEPLPGRYPLPGVGPFTLLRPSRRNHLGKRIFRWAYWNIVLPGRSVPVPSRMSMLGKHRPDGGARLERRHLARP